MVSPNNGWLRFWIQSAVATVGVAIVAMGCASPQAPSGAEADGALQTLGEVSVTRDGEGSIVFLDGLEDPVYSVTERGDENLVVVDLVGVGQGEASSLAEAMDGGTRQVAAYDGVVDMVTLSTFEGEDGQTTTRVEIQLSAAGRAVVSGSDGGLEVSIQPGASDQALIEEALGDSAGALAAEADEAADVVAELAAPASADEAANASALADDAVVQAVDAAVTVVPVASPAKSLTSLTAQSVAGGVLVGLVADGTLDNVEVFTLQNPTRLVVDVPGIQAAASARNVKLDSAIATGVRLGAHEGKLRIVVDGGSQAGEFASRQVMPGATGLWIALGEGEALTQAMTDALAEMESSFLASTNAASTAAPAAAAEASSAASDVEAAERAAEADALASAPAAPAEVEADFETTPAADAAQATGSTEVYGLSFERLEKMDRTAILADRPITFTTYNPDPTTLVVRIPKAKISEEASDRLFPEQGGPVSMIRAFQQPDVKTPEVRVVFTRAPNQQPVLSTPGSTLFVDFEDLGVAAAAPPAFPNAGDESPAKAGAAGLAANAEAEIESDALATTSGDLPTQAELAATPQAPVTPAALDEAEVLFAEPKPVAQAASAPAAVEVPAAIEVLEEGGLIDGKEYRGRRVSLDFKDVAIADVLRLIAEVSDLNIIAGDEVSGNVTIRLVDVPWDQALDVILMTKGLGFVRVGNVLRIAPADVLKAEEEVRLQERRNKEKLEDLEVKLLPVNYATVKDIEVLVRRLLSARGTVNLDARTNTLIIKDISSVIDEASALIAAIDTQTPQVMIEAKIVEANLDFSRELGSVWGIQTNQFVDPFDPDTLRTDLGNEDITFIDDNSVAFANPIKAVPTGIASLGALILDQDFRVDAQIQAAESTGDGKVISSPRIVTLDNKQATIKQGVSIPFQTFEGGDAKLEFIDAVLSLIVTPHITADQSIIMQIQVTRNAPDSTVPTPTGSPAIAKNVAQTQTLVKDGQTLVLGGIYTISKSQRQSRVPYLHRIPVVGNLFKNTSITDSRKELLVFVTPRIVRIPEMAAN
ncbi:MAG: type IV pilus secretin PilQ [Deltaproteobacteria bacterium]|nr:type IV pilus secretin PilQ [Deltaproteobacteria bacterium]